MSVIRKLKNPLSLNLFIIDHKSRSVCFCHPSIITIGKLLVIVTSKAKDETVLELLEYRTHPTNPLESSIINVGVCHIAFRVADAEIAYDKLVENSVKVLSRPVLSSEGIAKVFFCLDPDNVRVELVEMLN